jgi:hypothetical protein
MMKKTKMLALAGAALISCVLLAMTAVPRDSAVLEESWANLEKPEPVASRALLKLASTPAETTAFLKSKLTPIKLDEDDLQGLLDALGSQDETVWKPAYETMRYLDPRLAMDLTTLMKTVTDFDTRARLVAVLCDAAPDAYEGMTIELRKTSDLDYNFTAQNMSWWAEHKVSRLNASKGWEISKVTWTRAARAIALLEHFATPEAKAVLVDMTTGHRDAQPTKLAQEALDRLSLIK